MQWHLIPFRGKIWAQVSPRSFASDKNIILFPWKQFMYSKSCIVRDCGRSCSSRFFAAAAAAGALECCRHWFMAHTRTLMTGIAMSHSKMRDFGEFEIDACLLTHFVSMQTGWLSVKLADQLANVLLMITTQRQWIVWKIVYATCMCGDQWVDTCQASKLCWAGVTALKYICDAYHVCIS